MASPIGFSFDGHTSVSTDRFRSFTSGIVSSMAWGLPVVQMMVGASTVFSRPLIDSESLLESRYLAADSDLRLFLHGSLWCNLSGSVDPTDPKREASTARVVSKLSAELDIGSILNAPVVVHFGSSTDPDYRSRTMARTLTTLLTAPSRPVLEVPEIDVVKGRRLLLENSAGEGSRGGTTLAELDDIRRTLGPLGEQIGFCWDTAHCFGAGTFDFGDPDAVLRFFEIPELKFIELFHLNDSEAKWGSHRDRHAPLTAGWHFRGERAAGLTALIRELTSRNLPAVGETPDGVENFLTSINAAIDSLSSKS